MTEATKATQTEVGHEAGGGHANFPPFDSSSFPSQLLWLAITFGTLYYVMSKIALPKVGAVIENRKARIAKDLNDAAAMQQQADAAAKAHEKTLADARAKAQGSLELHIQKQLQSRRKSHCRSRRVISTARRTGGWT